MAAPLAAAAIPAAASLAAGVMGAKAQDKATQAARDAAAANTAMQMEFAKNGIRWKVADAKAAGIHPLYALGAQGASFSPVSIGETPNLAMPNALANMGQDIGRAISTTRTQEEKEVAAINLAAARANLDGQVIDNQIKAKTLSNMSATAPSFPGSTNFIPGQGNSPLMKVKPSERSSSEPGRPAQQAGWVPDVGYARTDTGLTPVPSQDVKERIEDQMIPELMWAMRNQIAPNLGVATPPPKSQLPKGADSWRWSFRSQEWQPNFSRSVPYGGRVEDRYNNRGYNQPVGGRIIK